MNIYNDSNYATQSSLPATATFDSITTNGIIIPAASEGDVLYMNATKEVTGLAIGPVNYLLQSDGANPEWSNVINVDTVTVNDIKINTTQYGDLLVGQAGNTGFFDRLPIGANNTVLYSNGTVIGWLDLGATKNFISQPGPFAVPTVAAQLFNVSGLDFILGRQYKISTSANITSLDIHAHTLQINGTPLQNYNYRYGASLSQSFIWTSNVTGAVSVQLVSVADGANTTVRDFYIFAEEF